uniref:negative elongation factor A-like n=1 Tax=Styela clava TaxID=7725 RepID=UPI001939B987|nr:negative elongation factor A-like [Styela clava]
MAAPRAMRDNDTALWLHNKLGSAEELWVSSSIGGIIKTDTIDNIFRCFSVLSTTVKMKLLLGILHLPRRSLEEMKHTIDGLVELALDDGDQWVKLVANVVKTYPMRCKLSLDLSSNQIAENVIHQLEEKVRDSDVFATLPLECQYVNKNALQNLVGNQPPPQRHFALKRKPKSAALRVDLMQKSTNASSQVKKGVSNKMVPVKHRDMTRKLSDASPMRGIPKTPAGAHRAEGFRTQSTPGSHMTPGGASRTASRFSSRAERGTKLLDISEQPLGIREQKRRKKQQQEDDSSQQTQPEEKMDETPEYAAGLVPPTMAQSTAPEEEPSVPTDANDDTDEADEDQQEEMEDEDEYSAHYSPAESPTNKMPVNYSSIDQEEMPAPPSAPPPEPTKKNPPIEKRPSIEDYPVYAMPATPSPYFKPTPTPAHIITSPSHSKPALSSPNTPSSHTSSSSTSSSSPSPARRTQEQPTNIPSPVRVMQSPQITQNKQISPVHSQPQQTNLSLPKNTQNFPQVPRFYSPPVQNQPRLHTPSQPQISQQQQQQVSIQQPTTVLHGYPAGIYRTQVPVRPGMPYIVSPNMVQRSVQIPAQTIRFAPSANEGQIRSSIPGLQTAVSSNLQHQLQLQQHAQQQAAAAAAQQAAQQAQQQQQQKKTLTLTREQWYQAQEMFRNANRLTRQEKSIILGFMAGSRDNPNPDKGDVVQITLSEHEQTVQNPVGGSLIPVVVETYFEMNYRTGTTAKKQRLKQVVAR